MSEIVSTGFDDPAAVYDPDRDLTAAVTQAPVTPDQGLGPETVPPQPLPAPAAGLTQEGLDAAKALLPSPFPKDFGAVAMVALARDLAMNIDTVADILKKHKLTDAHYGYLSQFNEFFKNTLAQQAKEWQGVGSTQDRLRAQAAAALESQFPTIASRMGSASEKLADVVEAAKLFAKVADVDAGTRGARPSGEGFTISIDLGADTRLTLGLGAVAQASTAAPEMREVRSNGEGAGQRLAIQPHPQGASARPALPELGEGEGSPPTIPGVTSRS